MSEETIRIPIIEEQARLTKRIAEFERVSVRTSSEEEQVLLRSELRREHVEVERVPVQREVAEAPPTRVEGDVTIVPVLEERLIVEKRLFLVEEVHLRRVTTREAFEVPSTVRRTKVEIDRQNLQEEENN